MTKNNIRIVKIPIPENEKPSNNLQVFPKMPRLYLELLENKSKIKQDLINKDYVPDERVSNSEKNISALVQDVEKNDDDVKKNESDDDDRKVDSDDEPVVEKKYDSDVSDDDIREHKRKTYDSDDSVSVHSEKRSKSSADDLSDRLKELLKEDDKDDRRPKSVKVDKYSRRRDETNTRRESSYNEPPKLSDIDSGNFKKEFRNIAYEQDDDEDAKRELIFKMGLLKKSYPNAVIQEFSIHSDYSNMKKTYDDTVRRLSLDSTVDNYKTYLIGGFMVTEFVLGNYLGFDMQGFTQQQIVSMNNYEKLLIELGEKSYAPEGSSWPVEVRLLGMILIQAGLFIVSRMIMKKTGSNLLGMINNMNINNPVNRPTNKRKMKGPSINLDEMPDIAGDDNV